MIQPLWKTVWRFLKKLKIELPYDPAIPLLDIYPEKTISQRDTCGTSLVVQWVRLHAPNAGGPGSIPGWGTRSHMHAAIVRMPQLRV